MESTNFAGAKIGNFSGGGVASVSHAGDDALIVQFYLHPVLQEFESQQAGRPIYKDKEYVWIRFAGDRTKEVRRKVDLIGRDGAAPDPERFPKQWMAFKISQVQVHEGTPLEQFPPLGASTVLNFKAYNIHTVEQLAAVPDSALHNLGTGAMQMREDAKAWLKAASDTALVTQQQETIARQQADIDMLKAQLAELAKKKKESN
jgi:hypothetical protein